MAERSQLEKDRLRQKYCEMCHKDFYNGHNDIGVKECLHLAKAKVKQREIYLSRYSTSPAKIRTLDCFSMRR